MKIYVSIGTQDPHRKDVLELIKTLGHEALVAEQPHRLDSLGRFTYETSLGRMYWRTCSDHVYRQYIENRSKCLEANDGLLNECDAMIVVASQETNSLFDYGLAVGMGISSAVVVLEKCDPDRLVVNDELLLSLDELSQWIRGVAKGWSDGDDDWIENV